MGRPYASTVSVISFISLCQTINYTSSLSVSWGLGFSSTLDFSGQGGKKDKSLSLGVLEKYLLIVSFVTWESIEKEKSYL